MLKQNTIFIFIFIFIFLSIVLISIYLLTISNNSNCESLEIKNNKELSDQFLYLIPKVLYINLEKRNDRRKEFLSNFQLKNETNKIERINAVLVETNGNIGCLKSHIKALKYAKMILPKNSFVFIAEDDLYIKNMEYARDKIKEFLENVKEWDVLMIGQNTINSKPTKYNNVIKIISSQTTSGYIIHMNYLDKLLGVYERDLKEFEKTGIWEIRYCTDQSWKELQAKDNWYAFSPTVGIQRNSYSDIMKGYVQYGV